MKEEKELTSLEKQWEIFSVLGIRWETVREISNEEIEFLYRKSLFVKKQLEDSHTKRMAALETK